MAVSVTKFIWKYISKLKKMDKIIVFDNGRIAEEGTHNTLIRKKGIYSRFYKMQTGGFKK